MTLLFEFQIKKKTIYNVIRLNNLVINSYYANNYIITIDDHRSAFIRTSKIYTRNGPGVSGLWTIRPDVRYRTDRTRTSITKLVSKLVRSNGLINRERTKLDPELQNGNSEKDRIEPVSIGPCKLLIYIHSIRKRQKIIFFFISVFKTKMLLSRRACGEIAFLKITFPSDINDKRCVSAVST